MKLIYYVKSLFSLSPVMIDGILCVLAAAMGYWESSLGKDEAFKYWNIYALYYIKEILGGFNASVIALIFFRSKSYTDHVAKQKSDKALIEGSSTVITTEKKETTNETQVTPTPPISN